MKRQQALAVARAAGPTVLESIRARLVQAGIPFCTEPKDNERTTIPIAKLRLARENHDRSLLRSSVSDQSILSSTARVNLAFHFRRNLARFFSHCKPFILRLHSMVIPS